MYTETEQKTPGISISSKGYSDHEEGCDISIKGLTREEIDKLEAAIQSGAYWITGKKGRLEIVPKWEKLPSPTIDVEMEPFWRKNPKNLQKERLATSRKDLVTDEISKHEDPSFHIKHLCGYNYSKENYKRQVEILESFGFVCMRSQRGDDAKFWETWYLPGLWAAEGDLKKFVKSLKDDEKPWKRVVTFFCQRVSFGSLDMCCQRAAMVIDE